MSNVIHPNGDHSNCLNLSAFRSPDVRAALRLAYARALASESVYGPLDLASDPRDFKLERVEEDVDGVNYEAFDALRHGGSMAALDRALANAVATHREIRERDDLLVMTLTETE